MRVRGVDERDRLGATLGNGTAPWYHKHLDLLAPLSGAIQPIDLFIVYHVGTVNVHKIQPSVRHVRDIGVTSSPAPERRE
jgi:hypothetical protein